MKPYMLPLTRNEQTKTPGNKFVKTPGKMMPPSAVKFTSTAKKHQNGFHSFTTPSKAPTVRNRMRRTEVPRANESSFIDNNIFVMNCSTSTEFDAPELNSNVSVAPSNMPTLSFSPFMRQIEKAIDLKLTSFMETLKNETLGHPTDMTQYHETIKQALMTKAAEPINETFDVADDVLAAPTAVHKPTARLNLEKTLLETTWIVGDQQRLETRELDVDAAFNFTAPLPKTRGNRRLTTVKVDGGERRSKRISTFREARSSKCAEIKESLEKVTKKIKNEPTPSFLNRSRRVSKAEHKKEVLELLNTGTYKQLKMLPKIGIKTAYQIITYRTINGKFKVIDDVQKVPAMRGKVWENFLEVKILKFQFSILKLNFLFVFHREIC